MNTLYFKILGLQIENIAKHIKRRQLEEIHSMVARMLDIRKTTDYDSHFATFKK